MSPSETGDMVENSDKPLGCRVGRSESCRLISISAGLTPPDALGAFCVRLSAVTRRYRTLTELRTSALLVRKSSPLCTDKPEGPGMGLLTLPGETGMPMVNGAYRARVLAPLISERGAKGPKVGEFTGGLVL